MKINKLKFVCVGDIHLRIRAGIATGWQVSRYKCVIDSIVKYCVTNKADIMLLGDQFDDINLGKHEIRLFLYLMNRLREEGITTFIVSGNHETISDDESLLDYFLLDSYPNVNYRTVVRDYKSTGLDIHLVNHDSLGTPTELGDNLNLIATHVRANLNDFIKEEYPIAELVEGFDFKVAGDIHIDFTDPSGLVYTNSPVNNSFERDPKNGFLVLDIDTESGESKYTRVTTDFPSLIRIDCDLEDFPPKLDDRHFYNIYVTGPLNEMKKLQKPYHSKITKVDSNAVLVEAPETASIKHVEISIENWEESAGNYLDALGTSPERKVELLTYDKEEL